MFKFKFVLVAILVLLGCALAQSLQGELSEAVREKRGTNGDGFEMPPCTPSHGSSTSAPATEKPTSAATTRPTTAPTSRPPTSATTRPTSAPTQKATEKPTQKPTEKATSAPTQKATSAPATQKPTQKATSAPTQKATSAPTQKATVKPTSAPATQKPTSAPVTQKPTNSPSTGGNYGSCDVVPASAEPLKMLLPLYNYPDSTWDSVAAAGSKIDIIAIINPSSGPGSASGPGTTYTNAMNKLNTAGVEQIGYVHTSYGTRSISDCKKEIDIYANGKFPHVVGIFFDEASNKAADIAYYRELYNYVLAKGYRHSVLNPGTSTDAGYVDISTNIVIYESAGSGLSSKSFPSYVKCAASGYAKAGYKYKFSGMAHSTSSSNMASMITSMQNAGMGMVFVTDGAEGCCTYNSLASYFTAETTAIQTANKI